MGKPARRPAGFETREAFRRICNPPSKKVRPPLEGFAIPSQYNESLVKKYIE